MIGAVPATQTPLAGWTVPRPVFGRLEETAPVNLGQPWTASTAYALGANVTSAARLYVCTGAGTSASSGGPTTTAGTITDGAATWAYVSDLAPVDLATLKTHLRKTDTAEDAYLQGSIYDAVDIVERYVSRRIIARPVKMWLDYLPGLGNGSGGDWQAGGLDVLSRGFGSSGMSRSLELLGTPVSAFGSFHYVDSGGNDQTLDPSAYIVDISDQRQPARLALQRGAVWPANLQIAHAINLRYTLGYGVNGNAVPRTLMRAFWVSF